MASVKKYLLVSEILILPMVLLGKSRPLGGYKFPVYTTKHCPKNSLEWAERSSAMNCTDSNGFTCLPNENFTEILEFCYTEPKIRIQKGVCLYLRKKDSLVDAYNCSSFTHGCPNAPHYNDKIFEYPSCVLIGKGCFLSEPSCISTDRTGNNTSSIGEIEWIVILGSVLLIMTYTLFCIAFRCRKKAVLCFKCSTLRVHRRKTINNTQHHYLLTRTFDENHKSIADETPRENARGEMMGQGTEGDPPPSPHNLQHVPSKYTTEQHADIPFIDNEKNPQGSPRQTISQTVGAESFHENKSTVSHELMRSNNENNFQEDKAKVALPLLSASFNGHHTTVQLLLDNGADVNLCNEIGISPLSAACRNGHELTVNILLENGADVNLRDKMGVSPLCKASEKGYNSIVKRLIQFGGNVDS